MNARHLGGWSWSPTLSASFPIQLLSAGSPYSDFFFNLKKAIPGTLYWSTAGWLQCWQFAERVRWKGDQTQMRSPDNKCQQLPRQKSSKIGSIQDIRWQGWARRGQHMSGCMQVIWKEDRNGQSKCGLLSWSWSENIRLAGQSRPARTEHLTYN